MGDPFSTPPTFDLMRTLQDAEAPVAYLTMVHHLLALVPLAGCAGGAGPLLPTAPQQPLQYHM